MLTLSHYIAIAEVISKAKELPVTEQAHAIENGIALICKQDNSEFNSAAFYAACNARGNAE